MSIMKNIIKWIVNFGIKCITKLVRTASEAVGTPKAKLPTERDVVWELGATAAKAVAGSKCKIWWSKIVEPIRNLAGRFTATPSRVSYATDALTIDV